MSDGTNSRPLCDTRSVAHIYRRKLKKYQREGAVQWFALWPYSKKVAGSNPADPHSNRYRK